MLASKLFSSVGNTDRLYVDDVFSAYTYTGNGSTQTINNGIDLAGKGGMVWAKVRSLAGYSNLLVDTARGTSSNLASDGVGVASTFPAITSFNTDGFTAASPYGANVSGASQIAWTFRKAPKFFDVVTYTGNGASSRAIAHSLGQEVGMVMTKATSTAGDWNTYHRSATGDLVLNTTAAQTGSKALVNSATATAFTVSGAANTSGATYVAYLFAHDPTADGIVQCGSYVANGSASGPIINLGWEPQYVMIKRAVGGTGNWILLDSMRGMSVGGNDATLCANSSGAENGVVIGNWISPTATRFQITNNSPEVNGSASDTYIYLAIRRPNKPPTTGTEVYNAITRTGTNSVATVSGVGFAPDLAITHERPYSYEDGVYFSDKLRGFPRLTLNSTNASAEYNPGVSASWGMDGFNLTTGSLNNTTPYVHYFFKRATGFFDVVCYTGTGAAQTVSHSLGVAPELMIVKSRGNAQSWYVFGSVLPGGYGTASSNPLLYLNLTNAVATGYPGLTAAPTSSLLSLDQTYLSFSGYTYVAYLFASLPGISKVGSYTGNGSSQTINCGFSTGARFILLKRTDSTGDWYVWDTARGIIAANDPHLSLNTTTAEVTTNDSVDPDSTGFIVNQVAATNINVNGATYIFLSIA